MAATWGDSGVLWGDPNVTWEGAEVIPPAPIPVYSFTPPVTDGRSWARDPEEGSIYPGDKLFRHYGSIPTGITVWIDYDGSVHSGQYVYQGILDEARFVYTGGHKYIISEEEYITLAQAGYSPTDSLADPDALAYPSDYLFPSDDLYPV